MTEDSVLLEEYHRNLPQRIRSYLQNERGISDAVVDRHLLGWNGSRDGLARAQENTVPAEGCAVFMASEGHGGLLTRLCSLARTAGLFLAVSK